MKTEKDKNGSHFINLIYIYKSMQSFDRYVYLAKNCNCTQKHVCTLKSD